MIFPVLEWLTAFIVAFVHPRPLIKHEINYHAWGFLLYTIANSWDIKLRFISFYVLLFSILLRLSLLETKYLNNFPDLNNKAENTIILENY